MVLRSGVKYRATYYVANINNVCDSTDCIVLKCYFRLYRHDTVFVLSMVSSFGSMIYTALWFNERSSTLLRWFFLAGPMYSAIFACRAFTAAVLLKTTVHDGSLAAGSFFLLLAAIIGTNLGIFRLCGQDWTRSSVFAIASTLLPAGYQNDRLYYQVDM